jgi:hypothetical protein
MVYLTANNSELEAPREFKSGYAIEETFLNVMRQKCPNVSGTIDAPLNDEDPEIKKEKLSVTEVFIPESIINKMEKFSNWKKLVKTIGQLKHMAETRSWKKAEFTADLEEKSKKFIISKVQNHYFGSEIAKL